MTTEEIIARYCAGQSAAAIARVAGMTSSTVYSRLYRAGVLQDDIQDLILLNCQVPHERLSDLRAQMAANRVGVLRFQGLCAKYGVDTVLGAADALLDYAERKMRAGIASLPDGSWRFEDVFDPIDLSETLPMAVTVTIAGDAMTLDFEATDQRLEVHLRPKHKR